MLLHSELTSRRHELKVELSPQTTLATEMKIDTDCEVFGSGDPILPPDGSAPPPSLPSSTRHKRKSSRLASFVWDHYTLLGPRDDPHVRFCSFFRKTSKVKNIRKRTATEDGENEDEDSKAESAVMYNKKKQTVVDNKLHFSSGPAKHSMMSESNLETRAPVFEYESSKEIQVQNDNRATATLETETDFSRDARAIRERVLKKSEEALKGKKKSDGDEKLYKGIHGYTDYKAGFRREHTVASEKAGGAHGPLRASAHIRVSARFDYQPDICKDYKETGYCGYGDSCKFMHDRGDYKSGWQLEKDWDEREKARKKALALGMKDDDEGDAETSDGDDDDSLPFACLSVGSLL